jgi:hypothetical protein
VRAGSWSQQRFIEAGLIVFFQLAHFEHELQVDNGNPVSEASGSPTRRPNEAIILGSRCRAEVLPSPSRYRFMQ